MGKIRGGGIHGSLLIPSCSAMAFPVSKAKLFSFSGKSEPAYPHNADF